jgi:plasmid stabilization system protein ParE
MALEVAWSPEAVEDLESIGAYIERDSAFYARAVVSRIVEVSAGLGQFPNLGRLVPEFDDPTLRERFVHSDRPIYRVEQSRMLIVAVIHGGRLLGPMSDRFI